jgi:hypothetical protein
MPLKNPWWEEDSEQRFWIEITGRLDLGADLHSPKFGSNDKTSHGYESMTHVKSGDIVLHYWQQSGQEPSIVAFSFVTTEANDSTIFWSAQGKDAKQFTSPRPAWKVNLSSYTPLDQPLTLTTIRGRSDQISKIQSSLIAKHGKPIYFPFLLSSKQPIRANQLYLTKFPRELVQLFPELQIATTTADTAFQQGFQNPKKPKDATKVPSGEQGYQNDPLVRKAVELQAMAKATEFLETQGFEVEDVSAQKGVLDLKAVKAERTLRIEVKGSQATATSVQLTDAEVGFPRIKEQDECWLIVVDQIAVRKSKVPIIADGGRLRLWKRWVAEDDRLVPLTYRYLLPPAEPLEHG